MSEVVSLVPGRFCYELEGARTKKGFPQAHTFRVLSLAQASFHNPLGARFWALLLEATWVSGADLLLRDGRATAHPVPDPLLSKSLASGCDSWMSCFEAWKAGTLSSSSMAELRVCSQVPLSTAWLGALLKSVASSSPSSSTPHGMSTSVPMIV